ncbi:MAG: amidophosphoribosyltransferase [Bacteroidetes bacterium]|nr:amidophosphoribosyltransferase [Bacteroidota bacterium]
MSEAIKHECGIVLIRLLKPLNFYLEKYGSSMYGLNKLWLMMEKQHNRGQDGAGVATIKLDSGPGKRYISRYRSNSPQPIKDIFEKINSNFAALQDKAPERLRDPEWLKNNIPFMGELLLGHLRYGTFGGNSIEYCHPFLRQSNWKTRNFVLAGNFNLTNVDELFDRLVTLGQHPKEKSDTVTVLEKMGHFLDNENQELFHKYKAQGLTNQQISDEIALHLDIQKIMKNASRDFDGGYAMAGMIGHGDAFVLRDPAGIRPAFYYKDDEVVVVASERPAIQTAFNVPIESISAIKPGHALIIKKNGDISEKLVKEPTERKECSFERIYFSRGSDADIYVERKRLGKYLAPRILKAVDYDFENTVFSYIPNTAEASFFGLRDGLSDHRIAKQKELLLSKDKLSDAELDKILHIVIRTEKIAIKDAKLRTFITGDTGRNDLVAHVYDSTYGVVKKGVDNLVLIDDSIVRGTTLKQSILRIMDRLQPRKIVIASSAPQIRYPDCYGIDMAKLGDFIAFQAAISLLKERGQQALIDEVYKKSKAQEKLPKEQIVNYVKEIYAPFSDEEISARITKLLTPKEINAEVEVVYQTVENLHKACPNHTGDWYFTGNYPTPGGNKVVNRSFINYVEGRNARAY